MIYAVVTVLLFVLLLAYFRIADHYNIIDHPNERSSHSVITIRGGGVVYMFAAVIAVVLHFNEFYWAAAGILLIGTISFLDDMHTLSSTVRIPFHIAAVTFMLLFLNAFNTLPVYGCVLLYMLAIGSINVYNFMDGINGITGAYSLVVLGGLQWINIKQTTFINPHLIWLPIIGTIVFLYFNFRKKAKCFAGDVGSVSIAFWILTLLLKLILLTNNWVYILFLAVYGVDSVLTIVHRIILKQNILKAHRLHFYQLLANEQRVPHLLVSAGYALVQLIVIVLILFNPAFSPYLLFVLVLFPLAIIYILIKPRVAKAV
ncbi:glycosyltransferase family 4 protein [Inquilinus sp. KBS0705]|nr:glycosyltransferase family 4 protein [Inquilinus sp. KBS0705]